MSNFHYKQKVKIIGDNKIYDFGYDSAVEGLAVLYEEGEENAQDSFAVKIENVYAV